MVKLSVFKNKNYKRIVATLVDCGYERIETGNPNLDRWNKDDVDYYVTLNDGINEAFVEKVIRPKIKAVESVFVKIN